jgi:VWFA-related protein
VHLRWGLVPLVLLFCVLPFHAQSVSGEGQAPAATFKAETRAVEVDVVVLDAHGEPVKGLRKEDFVIAEDGSPQTVTFFEEHPTATSQADIAANVLLIDTLNTPKEDLSFARKRVADYLQKMPAGTSLAVFSLGQTLRMVQGFTTDRALLLAAVNDKKSGAWSETSAASNMPQDDAEDKERIRELESMRMPVSSADMTRNAQAMHKTYQSDQRIAMTAAHLQRLARYLAKTPGRKNLIWFSSSFPIALFPEPGVRGTLTTTEQNQQIKDTTDLLAMARVAIYPVSAQGVAIRTTGDASDHFGTAQHLQPGPATGTAPAYGTSAQSTGGDNYQYGALSNEMRQEDNAHAANFAAMNALASATGGVMMPTSNDLNGMLSRAISDGSQYYTLSYAPTNTKTDGSFRRIVVTLHSGTYQLAYRRGYYATDTVLGPTASPATSTVTNTVTNTAKAVTGDPLSPLMRSGMAPTTQVQYEVRVQPVTPQPAADAARVGGNAKVTAPVTRYRADFVVHRGTAPSPDSTRKDRMQVEVIAYDPDGKVLNWQAGALNLTPADDATAQQRGLRTHMEIDVPKNVASLVTGVYDWRTNQAGTREISLSSLAASAEPHEAATPATVAPAAPSMTPSSATASAAPHTPGLVQRTPEVVKQTVKAERRIDLDVVVSDASGHAVSGLQSSDFTLLDQNNPQPIQSFRAVDGLTAEPPVEVVLVLDTMNTSFQQMAEVRQGVEKYLRQNGGHLALPVSAIFLTETGVKTNQATRDGNALAADIEKLPAPVHVITSAQGLDGLMLRFGRSVDALSQMTRYETTRPGWKLLIWVGDGWPMLSNARYHMDPRNQASFFHSIVDLSTNLREAHVALYGVIPLDLNKGNEAYAYLYQNFMKGVESAKQADAGNLSLQVLAEQSGGRAIGPTGDIYGGIVRCVADSNTYYELSFDAAPAERVDMYHALQVRLDKPGLTARTNTGYYAQP